MNDVAVLGSDIPSLLPARHKDGETVFEIMNAHERYAPLPLINDAAVIHHTNRNGARESDFYSMKYTSKPGLQGIPKLSNKQTLKQLLADMAKATSAVGETLLRVHAYTPADREIAEHGSLVIDDSQLFRIDRITCHRDLEGVLALSRRGYKGRLIDLSRLPESQKWISDIHDLIGLRNDRAYRHVCVRMGRHLSSQETFADNITSEFKAPRHPPFEKHFPTFIKAPNSTDVPSEDQAVCLICTDPFDDADHQPQELDCQQPVKHLFGRSCLLDWCNATGPEKVGCPTCRAKVFTNELTIAYLKYGVTGPDLKTYEPDPRYTDYENWERSCADLDKNLALNNDLRIDFQPKILTKILQHFLSNARLEPATSTPLHLQPVLRPELPVFVTEFGQAYRYVRRLNTTDPSKPKYRDPKRFGKTAALAQYVQRMSVSGFARQFGAGVNEVKERDKAEEGKGREAETKTGKTKEAKTRDTKRKRKANDRSAGGSDNQPKTQEIGLLMRDFLSPNAGLPLA
ncbi:hypothetical protein LTR86_008529 [Recurvomyces mirabilis]|nr:hypothetical protein LTR86_008529 [Recurvomyces mirabilis]